MEINNNLYNIVLSNVNGYRIFSSKITTTVKRHLRRAGGKVVAVKEHMKKVLVSDKLKGAMDKLRGIKNSIMLVGGSKDFKGFAYETFFKLVGEKLGIRMTKKGEQAYDAIYGNMAISLKTKKVEVGENGEFKISLGDYSLKGITKKDIDDIKSVDDLNGLVRKIFKLEGKNDITKSSVVVGNAVLDGDRFGIEHYMIDLDGGLLDKNNIKSFKKTKDGIIVEMNNGNVFKLNFKTNNNNEIVSINIQRFDDKAKMYDNDHSHNLKIRKDGQEVSVKSDKIITKDKNELLKELDSMSQLSKEEMKMELDSYFDSIGGGNLTDGSKVFLLATGDIGSISDLADPKKLGEIKDKVELYSKIYGISEADKTKILDKLETIGDHVGKMIRDQKNIEENINLFSEGNIKSLRGFDIDKIEEFEDVATILSTTRVMNQYSSNLYTKTLIDNKLSERGSELNSNQFLGKVNEYIQNNDIKGLKEYIKDSLGIEISDDDMIFGIAEDVLGIVGNDGDMKKSVYRVLKRNIGTRIALEDKLASAGYLFEAEIGSLGGMIKALSGSGSGIYVTPGLDIIDGFVKKEELNNALNTIEEIYGKSEFTEGLRNKINDLFGIKNHDEAGIQTFQLKATSSNRTFFNVPIIKDKKQLIDHMEKKYGENISKQLKERISLLESKIQEYKISGNEKLIDEISQLYAEISHSPIASKILFKNGQNKNNTSETNIIDDHSLIVRRKEGTSVIRDTKIEYGVSDKIKSDIKKIIKNSKNPEEALNALLSNNDINKGIRMEIENNDGSRNSVYKNGKNVELRRIS